MSKIEDLARAKRARDIDPVDLTIESSGNGWMGTFALTVKFLVADILSDGRRFLARITYELDGKPETVDVYVVSIDGEQLEVSEWGRIYLIDIEDIRKVEC